MLRFMPLYKSYPRCSIRMLWLPLEVQLLALSVPIDYRVELSRTPCTERRRLATSPPQTIL